MCITLCLTIMCNNRKLNHPNVKLILILKMIDIRDIDLEESAEIYKFDKSVKQYEFKEKVNRHCNFADLNSANKETLRAIFKNCQWQVNNTN